MAKKKRRAGKTYKPPSAQFLSQMMRAEELLDQGQPLEARKLLASLNLKFPNRPEVLGLLANACIDLNDIESYQGCCERLLEITPDDPDVVMGLAGSYMMTLRPTLALRMFRRFVDRFPDHPAAGEVRESAARIEEGTREMLSELGLTGEDAFEIAAMHEEINALLAHGKHAQAHRIAERLLERKPDFVPALNNLSQLHFIEGRINDAIQAAERALSFHPTNLHALSNLTRYLLVSGRVEEAKQMAERLKPVEYDALDAFTKKAEALSYLGDDEGVLEAFRKAEKGGYLKEDLPDPLIYHLAAVATMRLGDEKNARKLWKKAIEIAPAFDLAQENLDDFEKPVGERHAPWAFGLNYWVPRKTVDDLIASMRTIPKRGKETAIKSAVSRFLRSHTEIEPLIPMLLDRSDEKGREFAFRIASLVRTPALVEALHDFALSQRGPDHLRHQAAQIASEEGLLPSGPVRMWWDGEWRELLLFGYEIHGEPVGVYSPKVERLVLSALKHLHEEEGEKAEALLKQALELEPDSPSIMQNLAMAYVLQDREPEAIALAREINERHPDYVFAATTLARLALREGDVERADALLDPVRKRKRFHYQEISSLCDIEIELQIARGHTDGARSWLEIWKELDPDNPRIDYWEAMLNEPSLRRSLFGRKR
ncbi:MAG TPA: tetratricopeptide repeat protein [Blastocatellia bacterium]|nr:tetratricopeptide repeat protein [Blastocatellia bacterium]